MSAIDLSSVGRKPAANLTVKSIKSVHPKVSMVTFDGLDLPVKAWAGDLAKMGTPVTEGAEAEAVIEVKDEGEYGLVPWLVSFGGAPQQQQRGGGGRQYTPDPPAKIHSASVCGCVKSAIDYCIAKDIKDPAEIAKMADLTIAAYWRGIAKAGA